MSPHWTVRVGVAVGLLVAGVGSAAPAGAAPPAAPAATGAVGQDEQVRTVTLVTGDRVGVQGNGTRLVNVERGPGRTGVTFTVQLAGGHLEVTPSDALPLLRAGRLDPRLFDVTSLVRFGYDDRRADLPLIVSYSGDAAKAPARAAMAGAGARVVRDLPRIGALAVRQNRSDPTGFWNGLSAGAPHAAGGPPAMGLRPGVAKVWLDGMSKPTLDVSVPMIGAPLAWQPG